MITDTEILREADKRSHQAIDILDRLDLLGRLSAIGNVHLVGSVPLNVVFKPDIDLVVYVDDLSPRRGFDALLPTTDDPTLREITYVDARRQPINGIYWRLTIEDTEAWTVDIWVLTRKRRQDGEDEVARATRLQAQIIEQSPEARATILRIKREAVSVDQLVHGRWLYEAVVDHGVRSYDEYVAWMGDQDAQERSTWIPRARS